jgi:hypothetical protein
MSSDANDHVDLDMAIVSPMLKLQSDITGLLLEQSNALLTSAHAQEIGDSIVDHVLRSALVESKYRETYAAMGDTAELANHVSPLSNKPCVSDISGMSNAGFVNLAASLLVEDVTIDEAIMHEFVAKLRTIAQALNAKRYRMSEIGALTLDSLRGKVTEGADVLVSEEELGVMAKMLEVLDAL